MCAYVESSLTEAAYFASPCKFGPEGVKEVAPPRSGTLALGRGRRPPGDVADADADAQASLTPPLFC